MIMLILIEKIGTFKLLSGEKSAESVFEKI
jgi:hypothetical protein